MTSVGSESVAVIPGRDGRASAGVAPGDGVITRSDICDGGALGGVPSSGASPGTANMIQSLRDVVSELFNVHYFSSSKRLDEQMPRRWINARDVEDVAGNKGGSSTKEGLVRLLRHLAEGKVQKVEDIISASDLARKVGFWVMPHPQLIPLSQTSDISRADDDANAICQPSTACMQYCTQP